MDGCVHGTMWDHLPGELWERIVAADADAAAHCYALNSSFNRTAHAYLLRHNVLPRSLQRVMEEWEQHTIGTLRVELLLPARFIYEKMSGEVFAPPDQYHSPTCRGLQYEKELHESGIVEHVRSAEDAMQRVLQLIGENGGLVALQERIARERRRASYVQKGRGGKSGKMTPADARQKLRRGLKLLDVPWRNPFEWLAKSEAQRLAGQQFDFERRESIFPGEMPPPPPFPTPPPHPPS